ncbi:phosphoesterase family-domain-containing protein [Boletus reticuloceps]|uniref:Phosphoesterase family-domain-containing protein n=1 Tax=Boletus reticuloceps TaxID=495285 RepID=A0A8I2YP53_9AGAM|nr:phosphoesterase family-domain-containing protein [Boletus reticuloceps]
MLTKYALLLGAAWGSVAARQPPKAFTAPAAAPTDQSPFYVGYSNDTITNTPYVPGKVFDRFIQIWLENADFVTALADPVFEHLTAQGILLTSDYAVTHPSEPNYIASVGGDFFGLASDDLIRIPSNVSTIVDLLELKGISWSSYLENMPTDGYQGYSYTNPDGYTYYVRKHNPLVVYDSVGMNATRGARLRNFNDFAVDVDNDALPQWIFITPNLLDDGHDTSVTYAGSWLNYWLVPLLENPKFNTPRTLILLTFDENETYTVNNRIFSLLLGGVIPENLRNTTDDTFYTHYSTLSTVQNNWSLDNLGRQDINQTVNNVFAFVADKTGYQNNGLTTHNLPLLNMTGTYPGPLNPNDYVSWKPPTNGTGAGGGPTYYPPN